MFTGPYLKRFSVLLLAGLISFCQSACAPSTGNDASFAAGESIEDSRLRAQLETSSDIFKNLLTAPDGGVPEQLLERAKCVAVMPNVVKAAFIGGGRWGRGVVTCRDENGQWSPPAFVTLTGGSIGFQIGAEAADLVLFFTGEDAVYAVTNKTGLTLGGDISVAAGPVGRRADAKTDFSRTGIFSYAATKGIFAGISLEGSVLSSDREANRAFYGELLSTDDLVSGRGGVVVPYAGENFLSILPRGQG